MPSTSVNRMYAVFFLGLGLLMVVSTWLHRVCSRAWAAPVLSAAEQREIKYRKMRQDLLRDDHMRQLTGDLRPKLWVFSSDSSSEAPYLRACLRSIQRHNREHFRVMAANDRTFAELVPDWPFPSGLGGVVGRESQRRWRVLGQLHLLYLYGGLSVPAAFWCRRPLRPLFDAALGPLSAASAAASATSFASPVAAAAPPFGVACPGPFSSRMHVAADAAHRAWPDADGDDSDDAADADADDEYCYLQQQHAKKRRRRRRGGDGAAGAAGAAAGAGAWQRPAEGGLGVFGCRPHCPEVQLLIEQVREEAASVGESQERLFGRRAKVAEERRVGLYAVRGPLRAPPAAAEPRVRSIGRDLVGRVDRRGDAVTLERLLGSTPVRFSEDMVGVWIPAADLEHHQHAWFATREVEDMGGGVLAGLIADAQAGADEQQEEQEEDEQQLRELRELRGEQQQQQQLEQEQPPQKRKKNRYTP